MAQFLPLVFARLHTSTKHDRRDCWNNDFNSLGGLDIHRFDIH